MDSRRFIIFLLVFLGFTCMSARAAIAIKSGEDTKAYIIRQAHKKLEHHFSAKEYRFDIQPRWIPNKLLKQSPKQIVDVQMMGQLRLYTNFEVFYNQHGDHKSTKIQLKVDAKQKLPVVNERVRKGNKLEEDQLANQWVSMSQQDKTYLTDIDKLKGKTLRRTLLAGQPIGKSYVSRDLVIKAGDEVKVLIKRKGVHVKVSGKARENGAKGDRIKVFSNETKRKYEGEVLRPGVILWKSTL